MSRFPQLSITILLITILIIVPIVSCTSSDATDTRSGVDLKIHEGNYNLVVAPDEPLVQIYFQVKNTGAETDTYHLSYDAPSTDWIIGFSENDFELGGGKGKGEDKSSLWATVDIPHKKIEADVRYSFNLTVTSTTNSADTDSFPFFIEVEYLPSVELRGEDVVQEQLEPGQWTEFQFTVFNHGNAKDQFIVTKKDSPDILTNQKGWDVVFGEVTDTFKGVAQYTTDYIERKSSVSNVVSIYVPEEPENDMLTVRVTAQSILDPNADGGTSEEWTLTVRPVPPDSVVEVVTPYISADVEPGGQTNATIKLLNKGTMPDTSVKIEVTSQPDLWNVTIDPSDLVSVPTSIEHKVHVVIKVPMGYPMGQESIELTMTYGVQKPKTEDIVINVNVLASIDFQVELSGEASIIIPGDSGTYEITIINSANTEDSYEIEAELGTDEMKHSGSGWEVEVEDDETGSVGPGDYTYVEFDVEVPENASTKGEYSVIVSVRSKGDKALIRSITTEIEVGPRPMFELSLETESPQYINNKERDVKGDAYFKYRITNVGNVEDTINLDITMDEKATGKWGDDVDDILGGDIKPLGYDPLDQKSVAGTIHLSPPSNTQPGTYKFYLKAWSTKAEELGKDIIKEVGFEIVIVHYNLVISPVTVYTITDGEQTPSNEITFTPGKTLILKTSVTNGGTVDFNSQTSGYGPLEVALRNRNSFGEWERKDNVTIDALSKGASQEVEFTWTTRDGLDYLEVVADPYSSQDESKHGLIAETNEFDNLFYLSFMTIGKDLTKDMDDDKVPDHDDVDMDGDGWINALELLYGSDWRDANDFPDGDPDTDGDLTNDSNDDDDDGDGVADSSDLYPLDSGASKKGDRSDVSEASGNDGFNPSDLNITLIVVVIIIIVAVIAAATGLLKRKQKKLAKKDSGYTKSGEYKPWEGQAKAEYATQETTMETNEYTYGDDEEVYEDEEPYDDDDEDMDYGYSQSPYSSSVSRTPAYGSADRTHQHTPSPYNGEITRSPVVGGPGSDHPYKPTQQAGSRPPQAQGRPPQAQGRPPQAQGRPPQAQGRPPQAQGRPPQAQGRPPQAQGKPPQA